MSVPPNMMNTGPMMAAPPVPPMTPSAPMPGAGTPPAAAALPGMAQLAQAQSAQMMAMQDEMNKQIMMLIASLPTPNPAGEAAVSTPTTPMMGGANTPMPPMTQQATGMSGAAPIGGTPGAY